jgi:hypothetical protein
MSWLLPTGFIDALPIELRVIDRLLTRAARIAHGRAARVSKRSVWVIRLRRQK